MWLDLFVIRPIRPLARGRNRFSGVAWSAVIFTIRRLSRFMNMLFSALAAADCTTLETTFAQGDVRSVSVSTALLTSCPPHQVQERLQPLRGRSYLLRYRLYLRHRPTSPPLRRSERATCPR